MKHDIFRRYLAMILAFAMVMAQASGIVVFAESEGEADFGSSISEELDSGTSEPEPSGESSPILLGLSIDGIAGGESDTDATEITDKETTIKIEGSERYFKFSAEKSGTCTF